MQKDPTITWTAEGRRLDMGDDPKTPIPIVEEARSVSMGDGEFPYGIAVDAPLGVQMMRNFSDRLKKEVPDEGSWVRSIFRKTPAVTFDKNILLKILSQPKGEGIRFYFCMKSDAAGDILSLVAVGVDEGGKDLLYNYDEEIHRSGIQNIPTTSLVAEYGHPPGVTEENSTAGINPFVLFRYSENI